MFLFPSEKIGSEKSVSPGACLTEGGGGGGQKLFWQCLLERTTFQKGTSLNFFCTLKPRRICTTKKCCIYSHFTVLDSAGSKIYRGLVESVGMKKSAGEDDQYSYI